MQRTLLLAVMVALVVACKHPNPRYCDVDADCDDPAAPFCDLEGVLPGSDDAPHTCVPAPAEPDGGLEAVCEPNAFEACEGPDAEVRCNADGTAFVTFDCPADLGCSVEHAGCACVPSTSVCEDDKTVRCSAAGQIESIEACPLSCHSSGGRCNDVLPSNDLAEFLDLAATGPDVVLNSGSSMVGGIIEDAEGNPINIPMFLVSAPSGGVDIRVLVVRSIELNDLLNVGPAALAIVSHEDIVVNGVVRVMAGARSGCEGGGAALVNVAVVPAAFSGSGGGGFATVGAAGGSSDGEAGGSGGLTNGSATLEPLRGGCGGGGSASSDGSAGGGAIQLVSRTAIRFGEGVASVGGINAGGRGGALLGLENGGPPRGGGSGGGILLEAPQVIVGATSALAANGGGGRGGCLLPGSDGQLSAEAAPGGQCSGTNDGGRGATINSAASVGGDYAGDNLGGGGGGGGLGRIRINARLNGFEAAPGAVVSPTASIGGIGIR